MQNNDKKVLLQHQQPEAVFPPEGRPLSSRPTTALSLDIYEGETFGLVGESGCGKSTLGRTILQLYHQTYGRTMYYGASLDDLAPKYVIDTVKNPQYPAARIARASWSRSATSSQTEYATLSETGAVCTSTANSTLRRKAGRGCAAGHHE